MFGVLISGSSMPRSRRTRRRSSRSVRALKVATTGAMPPSVTKIRLRISMARVCPPASGLRSMGQFRYRPEGSSREDTRQTLSGARPAGTAETTGPVGPAGNGSLVDVADHEEHRAEDRDHVGDQAALEHLGEHGDVVERRAAQLHPPGRLLPARDQVVAVDAERVL